MSGSVWPALKVKSVAQLVTEKASSSAWKLGLENLDSWTGNLISEGSEFEGEGVAFREGDVLFGKLRPYLAKAWVADRSGAAVGDFLVMRPNSRILADFLIKTFLSPERVDEISSAVFGAKMPRVNWDTIRELDLHVPTVELQETTVKFLDRETAEIDAFIADQEELITLLTERRAATISHAVTKGLDPTVPMKDSRSVWFSSLPAHWKLMPVGQATHLIQTGPFGSQLHSHEYIDGGIPIVNPMHLVDGKIRPSASATVLAEKYAELSRHALRLNDVVVARRGELGRSAVTTSASVGYLCGTGSAIVRLRADQFDARFFQLVFSSRQTRDALLEYSVGSTMDNLNAELVGALRLPAPPVPEQVRIVEHLDRETAELDATIADAREAIALSRERRAALISAAVTGKIDVREHPSAMEGVA